MNSVENLDFKYLCNLASIEEIQNVERDMHKINTRCKLFIISSSDFIHYLGQSIGGNTQSIEEMASSVTRFINLYTDCHLNKSVISSIDYIDSLVGNIESSKIHSLPENSFLRVAFYYGIKIVLSDPDTFTDVCLKDINNENKLRLSPRLDDNQISKYMEEKKDSTFSVLYDHFDINAIRFSKYTNGITSTRLEYLNEQG